MAVDVKLDAYRDGFADALRWVLEVFNLDTEDEDELNRVLEGGACEGATRQPEADSSEPFATIIAPFDKCANCGATAGENATWNRTGGWTCGACGESDYPEAAE